ARLATGVARAANLLRTRPGRRRSPLTATVETLDVGRVSTGILVTIVARRTARRALARLAPRRALRHREA
ncbi:MAG TPA: hypothetical protein VNL94_00875, partial [Candidatus Binatia bacterium]|nr:hypothetical protein [Candidatus Binatia bacterium]